MFYHSSKNLKRNVKVKLDLTKKRYSIFTKAMQLVKNSEANGWYQLPLKSSI